jgi:hypothetical protein
MIKLAMKMKIGTVAIISSYWKRKLTRNVIYTYSERSSGELITFVHKQKKTNSVALSPRANYTD